MITNRKVKKVWLRLERQPIYQKELLDAGWPEMRSSSITQKGFGSRQRGLAHVAKRVLRRQEAVPETL